ncbi:MAG: GDSL-type esterase/lipase family protein [bacterium]|nr:GDSL-type esterase/lipase family protein [bacterium]
MKFTAWAQTSLFSIVLSLSLSLSLLTSARAESWEWKDNDRVVFLGDGLLEQEQYSGWVEAMLVASHPDLNLTFRNLGWSADTPAGESRFGLSLLQAGREPEDEGWKQLCAQLELTEPDVLVLGYGMASGLEGHHSELEDQGLAQFRMDYQRLLDKTREISPGLRLLLLSPLQPLNDAELETTLRAYSQAIQQLADANGATFVDLADCAQQSELRKDPIHLNDAGYKELAREIAQQLGLDANRWLEHPNLDALLKVILRKNTWWFHRSRPANMAYVFGFRKHEQGQNADEIPQFDALVAEEEGRIAQLRAVSKSSISQPEPRLESVFAEFEPQAIPEFTLGDELEITLWAQNPDLNKPIHMNFDAQGRLWVASSEAYPMIEVGQSAPDKIVVLEDTDDDGVADQSTVFADGLLIPTGVLPGDGGVYVAQSTDLLFLKDTDGDGRADVKRRVLSGFGTEDTHHNLHTLLWGPDGRLYMNQSVYTRTDTETPHGVVRLKAGGGFRYDTRSMRMEIFFRGLWNSWGHQFDSFGQSFLSDGAGFAGIAYSFPGATFNPTPKARQQLDLISPGNWPKFDSL